MCSTKIGMGRMAASLNASAILNPLKGGSDYSSRSIRNWAEFFYNNTQLPRLAQGAHIKTRSLIHDQDVRLKLLTHLRSVKPDDRTLKVFFTICGGSYYSWYNWILTYKPLQ